MSLAEESGAIAPFEINLGDEHTEFSGSVRMMTEVADIFGVSLTPQELKDWQTLGRAAYIVDQYLDAEKDFPMPDIAVELFSGTPVPGIPQEFTDDCKDWLERQPEMRQARIHRQLAQVRGLVEEQSTVEDVAYLVAVRHAESDLLADLLSLNAGFAEDARSRLKFNAWLRLAMRAGYLLDSFRDIEEDYESGASKVEPGVKASAKVGAYLLKDTVVVASKSPRALAKGAAVMVRYQLKRMHPDFSKPEQTI